VHFDEKLSAFVEIAGDDFPVVFHADGFCRFCSPDSNEKVIECPTLMQSTIHAYKVQPRKDKRGVRMLRLPLHIPDPVLIESLSPTQLTESLSFTEP
jgi:hypothetical protein